MKYLFLSIMVLFFYIQVHTQDWKTYPYHQDDTYITFPNDEGVHENEPTEWWYLVGHAQGETSGDYYSFMLTYFHHVQLGFQGFRIFNLTNETKNIFHPQTLPVLEYIILSKDSLNIDANLVGSPNESWKNQTNEDGTMKPFQYEAIAQQENGSVHLFMDTFKRPLIVGDSGFFYQGSYGNYTYYYSQTGLNLSGTITFEDITEEISGVGWLDRQYGTFSNDSGENYEWFCLQLSNGVDINIGNIFTIDSRIPDSSTHKLSSFYINDSTSYYTIDFVLDRLRFEYMPDSVTCYSQQWRFKHNDIDLLLTPLSSAREVNLPFRFYEGAIEISGTYNGEEVTGKGFAELLHWYEKPELEFINPDTTSNWISDGEYIVWKVLNRDDGDPLYYTLSYSIDHGNSYEILANNITDTSYYWNFEQLDDSVTCTFKLTGSSIDGTLTSTINSDEVTILNTSSVDELTGKYKIDVYPNPTNGIVHVSSSDIKALKLYQMNGKMIRNIKINSPITNNLITINLSNEKDGIYVLEILTGRGQLTSKIILNHIY